jgi:hypothetical protein
MKIKSLSLCAAILLAGITVNAQTGSTQIRAGLNLANVSVTGDGRVDEAKSLTSFQAGIMSDIKIKSILYFQTGLNFTGKGSKTQSGDPSQSGPWFKATSNPYYIEVPANLLAKVPIGGDARFFAGAGPYLAVGIAGKNKNEGRNIVGLTYSGERDIEFSNDDPTTLSEEEGAGFGVMKRFDYGLNGTVGIEGKGIVLGLNYGLGLAKLQSNANSSADENNKHRVISLTLGFKL